MNKTIQSWSFSRLNDFEACAYRAKLKIIDKIPEPERPLPPGKTEHANDRGTRIHAECEAFVRGKGPLPVEAKKFKDEFNALRRAFKEGITSLEGEWGFDENWEPCDWKTAWVRIKLDAMVTITGRHAAVIDYKTGRSFGNQIKHGEQLQMYALAVFLRYPEVEHVTAELWYLDVDELSTLDIVRPQGLRFLKGFDRRGRRMTSAVEFKPNPNTYSCQYCPYHKRRNGPCEYGV